MVAESIALELFAGVARTPEPSGGPSYSAIARRCAELLDARFQEPCRLGLAAEELGVDRTALAADAGFADQSHMTRVYKVELGVTPGVWRARHGRAELPPHPAGVTT